MAGTAITFRVELGGGSFSGSESIQTLTNADGIAEVVWTLGPEERDMIVMYHKFGYLLKGKKYQLDSNMVVLGENRRLTAMAKTVGLPVAMGALLILNGKVQQKGVQIPIHSEVYEPVLKALSSQGISFHEFEVPYLGYNPDTISL